MKRKIKVRENDVVVKVLEKEEASKDHLTAQIKYPKIVFKNKKKYTRKLKHKGGNKVYGTSGE
jgi:hypothetical protein